MQFDVSNYISYENRDDPQIQAKIASMNAVAGLVGDIPFKDLYELSVAALEEKYSIDARGLLESRPTQAYGRQAPLLLQLVHDKNDKLPLELLIRVAPDLTFKDLFLKSRGMFREEVVRAVQAAKFAGLLPEILVNDKCCDDDELEPSSKCKQKAGKTCIKTPTQSCALGSDLC